MTISRGMVSLNVIVRPDSGAWIPSPRQRARVLKIPNIIGMEFHADEAHCQITVAFLTGAALVAGLPAVEAAILVIAAGPRPRTPRTKE